MWDSPHLSELGLALALLVVVVPLGGSDHALLVEHDEGAVGHARDLALLVADGDLPHLLPPALVLYCRRGRNKATTSSRSRSSSEHTTVQK